jgi:hypothetical protein
MRDKLQQLLAIIDDHKESLPNGDYLTAMNLLRDLHRGSDHRRPWELVEEAARPRVLCFSDLVFYQWRTPDGRVHRATRFLPVLGHDRDPNEPYQGGLPHFENIQHRRQWVLQNEREECPTCGRVVKCGGLRAHQARPICVAPSE